MTPTIVLVLFAYGTFLVVAHLNILMTPLAGETNKPLDGGWTVLTYLVTVAITAASLYS